VKISGNLLLVLNFRKIYNPSYLIIVHITIHEQNQNERKKVNLHNKRRYVCLSVCMLPIAGRTAGLIKTKLGIGTHVDARSVLDKVKVIYLCVRYIEFMTATSGKQQ